MRQEKDNTKNHIMQFIYKNTPVNCTISRNSSVMQVITTASGATCHSGGKYQLMRVNSGSADPVASFSPKSATASCAISKNVSSGMTCIYLKGNHSITVGGSTSSVHSQTEGSIK